MIQCLPVEVYAFCSDTTRNPRRLLSGNAQEISGLIELLIPIHVAVAGIVARTPKGGAGMALPRGIEPLFQP